MEGAAVRGRPLTYTQDIADEICLRMACGESLRSICREEKFPSHVTVLRWALENREGFSNQYTRAREIQAETFADQLVDIADDGSNDWMQRANKKGDVEIVLDREHVTRSELRLKTRQWIASRILRKKYGDKADKESEVPDEDRKIIIEGGLPQVNGNTDNLTDASREPGQSLPVTGET